jgi:hypothetical protein
MSNIIFAPPIRLGGRCSAQKVVFGRLAVIPHVSAWSQRSPVFVSLKYFQAEDGCYKQVERAEGKIGKFVQAFARGGTNQ